MLRVHASGGRRIVFSIWGGLIVRIRVLISDVGGEHLRVRRIAR